MQEKLVKGCPTGDDTFEQWTPHTNKGLCVLDLLNESLNCRDPFGTIVAC